MTCVKVKLNTVEKVRGFVRTVSKFSSDFDLIEGRHVVDAKSIVGIFSLDLKRDLELMIHDDAHADDIEDSLGQYIVDETATVA